MANGQSVEKMQKVMDALQTNPAVVVAGRFDPSPSDDHVIDIFAHPREPIYDPEGLNDFMFELVPVAPSRLDYFHTIAKGFEQPTRRLALGRLCFDETVANTALSTRVLSRCTSLRVFPDSGHLLDAVHGRNQFDIPVDELGQRPDSPIVPEFVVASSSRFMFL